MNMQNFENSSLDDTRNPDLPEIAPDEAFCFHCGPDVPCFNLCCSDLTLPLTPYDVLRMRRQLGISSPELLQTFTELRSVPEVGFPLPMLRMIESPDMPCPFVTPAGCSIYDDRPGACRFYPLGRGTKITRDGIAERFFMVREDHCQGFGHGQQRTPAQWLIEEGLGQYNYFNDRYMRLMSLVRASGAPLSPRMAKMALLCLFQLEQFRDLINKMNIFAHVEITPERQEKIMSPTLEGESACLDFALDWMELIIFGKAEHLSKKEAKC